MSLGVVIKGPSGLVLAADSRVTLTAQPPVGSALQVNFDNASKLLRFGEQHTYVAAVTYGQALVPGQERTQTVFYQSCWRGSPGSGCRSINLR